MPVLHEIFCTLPVIEAQSSSDDSAIRYELPVLWMMSFFCIMGPNTDRLGVCDVGNYSVTCQMAPLNGVPG